MADLDSRNKRASAIGLDIPWTGVYPDPDGSLSNANDRQHMAYKYSGTLGASTVTGYTYYRTMMGVGG